MIEIQTDYKDEEMPVFICDVCGDTVQHDEFRRGVAHVHWYNKPVDACSRCACNIDWFMQAELPEEDAVDMASECQGYASDNDGLNGAKALIEYYEISRRAVKKHLAQIIDSARLMAKELGVTEIITSDKEVLNLKNDDVPFE